MGDTPSCGCQTPVRRYQRPRGSLGLTNTDPTPGRRRRSRCPVSRRVSGRTITRPWGRSRVVIARLLAPSRCYSRRRLATQSISRLRAFGLLVSCRSGDSPSACALCSCVACVSRGPAMASRGAKPWPHPGTRRLRSVRASAPTARHVQKLWPLLASGRLYERGRRPAAAPSRWLKSDRFRRRGECGAASLLERPRLLGRVSVALFSACGPG